MADKPSSLAMETASLCPICLQRLPARREIDGHRVDLVKLCPEHGEFRSLIWQGPPDLTEWNRPKTPSHPPVCYGEVKKGCPFDCGLCPEHGQHTCSVLLEVTDRCNLRCPVCFADSGKAEVADPPLSVIDSWYRAVRNASGQNIVIQLSGGEPTVRDDLPVIIALGRQHGFSFIQVNTNGLRLAESPYYARELQEAGLASVFLQFDGTTDAIYERLRGKALLTEKIRAIDHCLSAGLGVVLVPTVVPGINSDNLGAILDFALKRAPGVRGVHFQPISYFGRFPAPPFDRDRITLPQILRGIEQQTEGRMRVDNFAPPGCEHSHCSFHGNFLVNPDGSFQSLTRKDSCCCNKPTPAAEGARKSTDFLTRQWAAPQKSTEPSTKNAPESLDGFLERVKTHTFAVSAMAFQDVWNIDLERASNCCIHVLTSQEKLVPFCLYNLTSAEGRSLYRGTKMQVSPLDSWILEELGQKPDAGLDLTRLREYQLRKINETLAHAAANSPFYRSRLKNWSHRPLASLNEMARLPFTSSTDLCREGLQMLAVSQGQIDRVITLESSGTTGPAKRLYFTRDELSRTQAFFRCGMSQVLKNGYRALVLLPGELPASAGDLLARALDPMGVSCHVYGLVTDPGACAAFLKEEFFDCVVGIPVQVLSVLRHPLAANIPRGRIKSVFLTSDFVPEALVEEIGRQWGCPAFNHLGMTEMALSGGVECLALAGYHLREPDLYFEIIDPATGQVLPPGQTGEVVVTTLTRTGMPLIRYRTDDLSVFLSDPCPCGSSLPRLGKLRGRLTKRVDLGTGERLGMPDLDEELFVVPGLINFRAVLTHDGGGINHLSLTVESASEQEQATLREVNRRLPSIPSIRKALDAGTLHLPPASLCESPLPVSATVKRNIEDLRKEF